MKWVRLGLQIIGAAALLALSGFGWMIYGDMTEHVGAAGKNDVLFVLNWGGIKTDQEISVIGSYRSPRNLTGDHSDSYCIQISKFELADFAKDEWHDGPAANPILADALELAVNDARQHASCFPTFDEANSSVMKISFTSVVVHDGQATAADIILYAPKTKMLYYVSFKT
jgi:hypothetical protein